MSPVLPFEVPTTAIEAFESWSGLRVTVHDLGDSIAPFLRLENVLHTNPFCEAVKASGHDPVCTYTDQDELHPAIAEEPDGRIKLCPAGLIECVIPVFLEERLAWVLFAGVRTPGEDLAVEVPNNMIPRREIHWPSGGRLPPRIGAAEAQVCLESLRQLAARLRLWWEESGRELRRQSRAGIGEGADPATRRFVIRNFVLQRYGEPTRLADLAERLGLSESRAAHVVKEVCGATFHQLLTAARLQTAAALLRLSDTTLSEVAARSGFGDLSHFSRRFRAWTGLPPGRYRAQHRRASAARRASSPSGSGPGLT
jgi:AraC-like DNA-binding protein